MTDFNGAVPRDKVALCGLDGVSDYIASAVRCFAFDEPEPLIDTNTVRIVGRLFGLPMKDSSRRNPIFKQAMSELLDRKRPRVIRSEPAAEGRKRVRMVLEGRIVTSIRCVFFLGFEPD